MTQLSVGDLLGMIGEQTVQNRLLTEQNNQLVAKVKELQEQLDAKPATDDKSDK